jgi:sorting nexin-8
VGKALPPGLEDSLAPTLNDLFERTRTGVRRSADIYISLCNLMDRLAKRKEGLAADHSRVSLSLQSLTDASADAYATDTNLVPLLNEGLLATAKHMSNSQSLLEDEARAWDQGVLEDLKRQRDALVSMRDMFDRRDRYDKDNIPYLERRIQSNESKLVAIRSKPSELIKPGEIDKVTEAIIKVSFSSSCCGTSNLTMTRIRSRSWLSMPVVCSSKNAYVTNLLLSNHPNTM